MSSALVNPVRSDGDGDPLISGTTKQQSRIDLRLSPREREIALKLAKGAKNSEIAKDLGISQKTVDTHRSHILKKLECRHNVDLAHLAIMDGLVEAGDSFV